MARKIDNPLVRRSDLDETRKELKGDIAHLAVEMDRRFTLTASQASLDALEDKVDRFIAVMDHRFTLTASQASMDSLTAKVDRFIAAMDRTSGEQADNRRSLIIYDSVLGEHRRSLETHERRISAIESRLPPQR